MPSTPLLNPSVYDPGADITAEATTDVTARTCLAISGNRASGGNIAVTTATAGGRIAGVARNDALTGRLVTLVRGNSRVVKITANGTIAAFDEVQVGANGRVVTKTTGVAVGYAVTGATSGNPAEISLY